MGHFRNEYGQDIELERVWMKENGSNLILNGNIHMSEPYYIYEAIEFDTPKKIRGYDPAVYIASRVALTLGTFTNYTQGSCHKF